MKAIVYHGVDDIRLEDVPEPTIEQPHDAIVRITVSAICGTDLHLVRGEMPGMRPGTIVGHEGVGVVEEVGPEVRNFAKGDRVVIASTIACGYCSYCRAGYFSQCDNANPNGPRAGTCFFGGPASTGPIDGLQADFARVPFANVGMVRIPDEVSDEQAIMISDIFPTGYFGAEMAEITNGDTVAVFGCGPVGLFAIVSSMLLGAGRVLAVDRQPARLELARKLGAEVVDFDSEDPVDAILGQTGGIGVDRAIDAVGIEAEHAGKGPAAEQARRQAELISQEERQTAPDADWRSDAAPAQALTWAIGALAKAGTLSVIGVYPPTVQFFPLGQAMNTNLTIKAGNCPHRRYMPMLMEMVASGEVHPEKILSDVEVLTDALGAYKAFDERKQGWIKVGLLTGASK
ncbi:MAG: alcohol dehydrogenase catalytic domain-containing protein [Planctomycetes bacterium]|nr:alcohol dehydrogenase catalytic domain-containing protein [Planctomycetota bacterium]